MPLPTDEKREKVDWGSGGPGFESRHPDHFWNLGAHRGHRSEAAARGGPQKEWAVGPPPVWVFYVGVVTGILGTVHSIIAITRMAKSKRLDLLVELRKQTHDNVRAIRALSEFIDNAWQSHRAALHTARSGAMEAAKTQAETDRTAVAVLRQIVVDRNYDALSEKELEDLLLAAHHTSREIQSIRGRYEAWRVEDDKDREFIRAQHLGR
jgi:hypothetical protein